MVFSSVEFPRHISCPAPLLRFVKRWFVFVVFFIFTLLLCFTDVLVLLLLFSLKKTLKLAPRCFYVTLGRLSFIQRP
jgi:hypothetical protein